MTADARDLDELDDADLDEPGDLDPAKEPRLTRLGWTQVVGGVLGFVAAFALILDRIELLKDPDFVPSCSINPLLSCGTIMKTGQAAENQRVGQLLNDVLEQALRIDWQRQAVRRQSAPLPPLGVALGSVPLVERLRAKSLDGGDQAALLLTTQYTDLGEMDGEFWQAFDTVTRHADMTTPAVHVGGWFDTFSLGTVTSFQGPSARRTRRAWWGARNVKAIPCEARISSVSDFSVCRIVLSVK